MTDKEKQIAEMAKEIFNTCAWRFGRPNDYKEIFNDIAEDLIKLGYTKNKFSEGSIVLSKEEYKQLYNDERASYYRAENLAIENDLLNRKLIDARKETAREICQKLYDETVREGRPAVYKFLSPKDIKELAKQFGVEVEE